MTIIIGRSCLYGLSRRKADPVGIRFARHRDPHPSATEHAQAVHAQSTGLIHAPSTRHSRRLHIVRTWILDFTSQSIPPYLRNGQLEQYNKKLEKIINKTKHTLVLLEK